MNPGGEWGLAVVPCQSRLADRGQLIFNIALTKDGGGRLPICAALDYKQGQGLPVGLCGERLPDDPACRVGLHTRCARAPE
jgi:hypothetical protein